MSVHDTPQHDTGNYFGLYDKLRELVASMAWPLLLLLASSAAALPVANLSHALKLDTFFELRSGIHQNLCGSVWRGALGLQISGGLADFGSGGLCMSSMNTASKCLLQDREHATQMWRQGRGG